MAATLHQIAQYLNNHHWCYHLQPKNSRIVTGVKADNLDNFLITITLKENGEYLELAAPQLLHAKDHIFKGVLFQTLLAISWEYKMVRWEYDPMDGEIRVSITFPLEDAPLTEQQFNPCLTGLIQVVDSVAMPRIKSVLETGIDPGEKEKAEILLQTLQQILPNGSLDLLEQALQQRKQGGTAA